MGVLGIGHLAAPASTPGRRCWSPTPRASGSGSAAAGAGCLGRAAPGRAPAAPRPAARRPAGAGRAQPRPAARGARPRRPPAVPARPPAVRRAVRRPARPVDPGHRRRRRPDRRPARLAGDPAVVVEVEPAVEPSRPTSRGRRAPDGRPGRRRPAPGRSAPRARAGTTRGSRTLHADRTRSSASSTSRTRRARRRRRAGHRRAAGRQRHAQPAARPGRRAAAPRCAATVADDEADELEGRELRRPGSVDLVEDTQVVGRAGPPDRPAGNPVEPLVIDEFAVEPADDPVIGPELAAARTRLGLSVDQLAERTRIRPHVIESIEVDDFAPCGGDFYARGHLRTLARVLGHRRGAAARRPTTSATPTRRSTRAGCSRPSWPPACTARSAAPAAGRTGRCWSPP